jgi:sugar phosphate isomerase/epimerase
MREYSLAYLTACHSTVPQALGIAARLGYAHVGLRLAPNSAGAPHQAFLNDPAMRAETLAVLRDVPVQVFDLEIIRINEHFQLSDHLPLLEAGALLQARAVLVAADDRNGARLSHHFASLCETVAQYGMTADLEFMPWTAVKTAAQAQSVWQAAGQPKAAGILVDALHFGRSDTSLTDIAALPRQALHYTQWCDALPGTHFSEAQLIHTARQERLPPGEGGIDLAALAQVLPAELPISVEVPNWVRQQTMGDEAWSALCLQYTRKTLGDST